MIYDSRPYLNAQANKLKGGGYEDSGPGANYTNTNLSFCDIENIHTVRSCYEKMSVLGLNQKEEWRSQIWLKQLDDTGYR